MVRQVPEGGEEKDDNVKRGSRGRATVRVGCSGWEYADWRGDFYPENLPKGKWLAHYAARFDTVEINSSFYRLPEASTFERWACSVPPRFAFAVKASRFLTHLKKLKDPEEPLARFFERAGALGRKMAVVLYQLPPRWRPDIERFERFLEAVPARPRQVIEFRDAAWYDDRILAALERKGLALCLHDMPGSAPPRVATAPFLYVRFHGYRAKYDGSYPDTVLSDWAEWLGTEAAKGRPAFVYFNNDWHGHAPRNAARLLELLGEAAARRGSA